MTIEDAALSFRDSRREAWPPNSGRTVRKCQAAVADGQAQGESSRYGACLTSYFPMKGKVVASAPPVLIADRRPADPAAVTVDADHVPMEGFSDTLRRLLRIEVLRGECSAGDVASLCSVHRRTLSRRLRAEGTAFRRLSDEVRFEIACRLLCNRRMTFAQIATTLGFSEASAFTRAFRRWSGQTPTAWRDEHRRPRSRG